MKYIYGDYETYSPVNLPVDGAHKYVTHPKFRPLILAYQIDDREIVTHQFHDAPFKLPDEVLEALFDEDVMFVHHGPFDRLVTDVILMRNGFDPFPVSRSIDTSILARQAGIPASLGGAANTLRLKTRKNPVGYRAIRAFCLPPRQYPEDDPELWEAFVDYARDDTVICRMLHEKLPPLRPAERALFNLDQKINDRGIRIDVQGVQALQRLSEETLKDLDRQVIELTGGAVAGVEKTGQLATYLDTHSVAEANLEALIPNLTGVKKQVAELRLAGAKSSAKKLPRMTATTHPIDNRSRGVLQFCGTRTLRWAGRAWQPQNLPRDALKAHEVDHVILNALRGDYASFKEAYPNPLKTISMCMRGMVVPKPGHTLLMADYSQIEARLVAWYAGQWDALDVYESGGDVYKEMASAVFSKPVEDIDGAERFIGKTLVLSSGYGQGKVRLQAYLEGMGTIVTEDEAGEYTSTFREKWPYIPQFWWDLKEALFRTWESGEGCHVSRFGRDGTRQRSGLKFGKAGDSIYIEIATGARCWFHGVKKVREPTPWDETQMHTVLQAKQYSNDGSASYYTVTHMIMAENVCSMTARELMAGGMLRLDEAGFDITMTVHDEIIMEVPDERATQETLEQAIDLMCERPAWGLDIPLAVEAQWGKRYGK